LRDAHGKLVEASLVLTTDVIKALRDEFSMNLPNFAKIVRRTSLPRTPVNKGKKKGADPLRPRPFQPLTP